MEQVSKAVNTIARVAQALDESKQHSYQEAGYLAKAINELEVILFFQLSLNKVY